MDASGHRQGAVISKPAQPRTTSRRFLDWGRPLLPAKTPRPCWETIDPRPQGRCCQARVGCSTVAPGKRQPSVGSVSPVRQAEGRIRPVLALRPWWWAVLMMDLADPTSTQGMDVCICLQEVTMVTLINAERPTVHPGQESTVTQALEDSCLFPDSWVHEQLL